MARTSITVTGIPGIGAARRMSMTAADATNGMTFANPSSRSQPTILLLQNTSGAEKTVTLRSVRDAEGRLVDRTVTIPARAGGFDGMAMAGPFIAGDWAYGGVIAVDTAALGSEVNLGALMIDYRRADPTFGEVITPPFDPPPDAYWRMESVSTSIPDSAGTFPLTVAGTGASSAANGIIANALNLAPGNFVVSQAAVKTAGEWTLSFWLYANTGLSLATSYGVFEAVPLSARAYAHVQSGGTTFRFGFTPDGTDAEFGSPTLSLGAWHHCIVRWTSGGGSFVSMSCNGGAWFNLSSTANGGDAGTVQLGSSGFGVRLPGRFDEVAFWRRRLTDDQALAVRLRGQNALPLA